ncbi:CENP-B protein [Lentithecium fluviatile CBS 122367]|uniref:CENP-B protein n=1 Tax=Lentithecium fluviatile CBS 122367 TaxID=1168545 RepID=A0A6G1J8T4_9PLEO|nr:CENP-B protein [Lentithecium fluviatile CBS 122367]
MDETGVALGVCTNTRVLARALKKKAYVKSLENREWVLIIECVSATGRKRRCAVIFKGQSLQTAWFSPSHVPSWFYTTSENGWTSKTIGVEWLQRIYIPETTVNGQYRLLILDDHGSHIDIKFLWLCKQNRIELLYLPAHSSHGMMLTKNSICCPGHSMVQSSPRNTIRLVLR